MRRIRLFILTLLGLVITIAPVAAQGGSITQIIDSNSDLTRLSLALDAVPEVREKLNNGDSYTIFAPTDQAFRNLSSSLENLPFDELLRDPEIISAILNYHIIEKSSLSAEQIAQRSGEVVPTLLPGAFISFRLNDDQTIALNNVVEIERSMRASNGWVHIIDDVLLNRVIDTLLDVSLEEFLASGSVSTPTVEPTATEAVTEIPLQVSNIRFAHFGVDVPAVDVYVNSSLTFADIDYESVSDFSSLISDNYNISIMLSDTEGGEMLFKLLSIDLADGDFLTFVLTGSPENDTLKVDILAEDYSALESDSRVLIYNALQDAPELDISLGDMLFIGGVGQNDGRTYSLDEGIYSISVYAAGDTENSIFEHPDVELAADSYSFIALVGSTDESNLVTVSVDVDTIENLRLGTSLSGEQVPEITETPTPPVTDTILDVLKADERFSIYVEALDAADSSVINRLASRNLTSVTVLAPTNQAYENLFFSVRRSRVFGNRNLLTQVLQYHVIEGEILLADFEASAGTSIITLLQPTQAFYVSLNNNGDILLNRFVQLEETDIQASNGVIHVIDDVLLPQAALDAWFSD